MRRPTKKDQKFHVDEDRILHAEIALGVTREDASAPTITQCRHAVLTIKNKDRHGNDHTGYVVYDRLLCRIVNGTWYDSPASSGLEGAMGVAVAYNEREDASQDMSPNGAALGLVYPTEWDSKEEATNEQ